MDWTAGKRDWLFRDGDTVCSFRSAGVLIRDGKLLVQRDRGGDIYALPGGHVKAGEPSADSLVREYKEETGADILCRRLLWVEECFWRWNGRQTSTVTFYYLIDLCDAAAIPDTGRSVPQRDNCDVLLEWMPLEQIPSLTIYPSFVKEKVFAMQPYIEHLVTYE